MMRFKRYRKLIAVGLSINVSVIFCIYVYFTNRPQTANLNDSNAGRHSDSQRLNQVRGFPHQVISPDSVQSHLTIIIREFEDFENDLVSTITHLRQQITNVPIVVIVDQQPYPPVNFGQLNVSVVKESFDLQFAIDTRNIHNFVRTEYVLFVPDGTQITELSGVVNLLNQFQNSALVHAYAIQTGKSRLKCPGVFVNLREWSIHYTDFEGSEGMCDYVEGDQAILMRTDDLSKLRSPFTRPLHKSLYIQFILKKWKVVVFSARVFKDRVGLHNPHSQWKHKHLEDERTEQLFKKFKIKLFTFNKYKKFYYGCTKDTERCFDTVINDVPDFIYQNKWTPPCCLKAVRETAQYVFKVLDAAKVRYWLEGGSLLGAARDGDIIPWDYDVDVGIYKDDIPMCKQLLKAEKNDRVLDGDFLWTKAIEGEFFRVYYSDVNKNHVDIFPFYSKDGTMTKNTWFKTHRQDTEFPEHYLKPLTKVFFIGMNVSAPNNVEEFLEFKFGKGVIEHPKYPDQKPVF